VTNNSSESRRQVLRAIGIGTTVALAGCSGSGGGGDDTNTTSDDTETEERSTETSSNNDTPSTTDNSSESTDEASGKYPQQESSGTLQANIDEVINNNDGVYGLKVSVDDLNIEKFPNLVEQVNDNIADNINELGDKSQPLRYDKALYVASNMDDIPSGVPEKIYFLVADPDVRDVNSIQMFPNPNNHGGKITDADLNQLGVAARRIAEDGSFTREYEVPLDESKPHQKEFLSETLSADDVVHAVSLEDTYVEDAIE
jgi:hypothetical protein